MPRKFKSGLVLKFFFIELKFTEPAQCIPKTTREKSQNPMENSMEYPVIVY